MSRVKEISGEIMVFCGDKESASSSGEPFNMATVREKRGRGLVCVSAGRGRCCLHKDEDRERRVWVDLNQEGNRVTMCGVEEKQVLSTSGVE